MIGRDPWIGHVGGKDFASAYLAERVTLSAAILLASLPPGSRDGTADHVVSPVILRLFPEVQMALQHELHVVSRKQGVHRVGVAGMGPELAPEEKEPSIDAIGTCETTMIGVLGASRARSACSQFNCAPSKCEVKICSTRCLWSRGR